jgi:arginine decarboxylase
MTYMMREFPETDYLQGATNPRFARVDAWGRLGRLAERLSSAQRNDQLTQHAEDELADLIAFLRVMERFWVYPGTEGLQFLESWALRGDYAALAEHTRVAAWQLGRLGDAAAVYGALGEQVRQPDWDRDPSYFTVLVVTDTDPGVLSQGLEDLGVLQRPTDDLVYRVVVVESLEAALAATLMNHDIQAVITRYDFPLRAHGSLGYYADRIDELAAEHGIDGPDAPPRSFSLAEVLRRVRPHLNIYLLTDESLPTQHDATYEVFDRVFYRYESRSEVHVTLLAGVRDRRKAPFFDALKHYAERPIGNFHALPIARGNSLFNSRWMRDMVDFYGRNIFLAETSSTSGGLDSLLSPTGSLKEAQDKAAATWGSHHTFFATNGTSTSNKVVVQALTRPGDVVLIDRNCHKSHHYGMILGGAHPVYLDAYPLPDYALYGAVPLRTIKQQLLELRRAGRLDSVRMILLTNCTFDGLNYNPTRVMEEILAIKPDVVFLWDEAWFAFANAQPLMRRRTGMYAARKLEERLGSPEYRQQYKAYEAMMADKDPDDDSTWLDSRLMPHPERARVRVYTTHSTHKSLSALRQGSMIHVYDHDFERLASSQFHEAFNTHTSTSPNYQILASLDLARRQMDLEGYGMVSRSYEIAFTIRRRLREDPMISKFMRVLTANEMVPETMRSGSRWYFGAEAEGYMPWAEQRRGIAEDEFVLDPTRITIEISGTGLNGDEFKNDILMDRYGIQVNKTSINSVLFIITIGATWGSVDFLLDVLHRIALSLEEKIADLNPAQRVVFEKTVSSLRDDLPSLPDFSAFHESFRPHDGSVEGDMRSAFFLGSDPRNVRYLTLQETAAELSQGNTVVSTSLVVPYPPGFPILVPGQVVSEAILNFMQQLDVKEIHGYDPSLGLSVFTQEALERA